MARLIRNADRFFRLASVRGRYLDPRSFRTGQLNLRLFQLRRDLVKA